MKTNIQYMARIVVLSLVLVVSLLVGTSVFSHSVHQVAATGNTAINNTQVLLADGGQESHGGGKGGGGGGHSHG